MKNTVGSSERTIGKHDLLDKLLKKEVETMSYGNVPFIDPEYTIMDLCAGDGTPSRESNVSSPELIKKHCGTLLVNRKKVNVILVEKNKNTFSRLSARKYNALLLNCDALEIKSIPIEVSKKSACFIHADPNHIEDWPISPELLENAPHFTTMLLTLGCNVGGLKRMPLEARQKWYERMDNILRWLPKRHDALLISLRGDMAQWAYMIIGPKSWHDKKAYSKVAEKAFKTWSKGVDMVRYRTSRDDFFRMRDSLFLTAKEVANAEQQGNTQ